MEQSWTTHGDSCATSSLVRCFCCRRRSAFSDYRIYFGKDGDRIIILLGDSDKKGQPVAILNAQAAWALYKKRKTKAGTN